jgi:hypothetical protein
MFGLFKRKKKIEQEQRSEFFYKNCITEIQEYISNCSEPSREDLLKISINAKITYELFRNVNELQPVARNLLHPLITNGLAVFIEIDNMEEHAALERMQSILKNTINQLIAQNTSELTLPSINAAFIMSKVIDFNQRL